MPNHFATLDLPARPWLDPDVVKEAFHRLGAVRHPDAPGGAADAFAAVNAAWQVLRDPAQRLRHLLELEGAAAPAGSAAIPAPLADTFMDLAALRKKVADFLARQSAAGSALARALLAGERTSLLQEVQAVLGKLDASVADRFTELRAIDEVWEQRDQTTLARLADVQQALAFTGKWSEQLREAHFALGGEPLPTSHLQLPTSP